jgi:hypothetical protein
MAIFASLPSGAALTKRRSCGGRGFLPTPALRTPAPERTISCSSKGRKNVLFLKKEPKNFCSFGSRLLQHAYPRKRLFASFLQKRSAFFTM